jgi:hypothetical protein
MAVGLPLHCRLIVCFNSTTAFSNRTSAHAFPLQKNFPNHPTHPSPRRQPMICKGFPERQVATSRRVVRLPPKVFPLATSASHTRCPEICPMLPLRTPDMAAPSAVRNGSHWVAGWPERLLPRSDRLPATADYAAVAAAIADLNTSLTLFVDSCRVFGDILMYLSVVEIEA